MMVLPILLIGTCLITFIQDFHSRQVMILLFPVSALLALLWNACHAGIWVALQTTLFNTLAVVAQWIALWLYFKMRGRPLNELVGGGDFLFLLACCFLFSTANFLLFYITSLLFTLLLHFAFKRNHRYTKTAASVALAGWQSCYLVIILLIMTYRQVTPFSDAWLLSYIYDEQP